MSHRCTECGRVIRKNCRALLDGCPDCGCQKFVFQPTTLNNAKSNTGKSVVTKKSKHRNRTQKSKEEKITEIPELASFESVRLVEEGTYFINIKNIIDDEPFVLGLEDGRYVISLDRKSNV